MVYNHQQIAVGQKKTIHNLADTTDADCIFIVGLNNSAILPI